MNIIKKIVRILAHRTKWYQIMLANIFYRSPKYERLDSNEKTAKRICYYCRDRAKQLTELFSMIEISIDKNSRFQHWIDSGLYFSNYLKMNGECPPNYSIILEHSLNELLEQNKNKSNIVEKNNYNLLCGVSEYIERCIYTLKKIYKSDETLYLKKTITYFENMQNYSAKTLEEGLQRILFWASLFWQTGHSLIGFGRLDKLLGDLEVPESEKELESIINDFYSVAHKYYGLKSNTLLGDTGQLIILGGLDSEENYFSNRLTYAFLNTLANSKVADPKILLRVSKKMPNDLLKGALKCIATGIGSPLLSNDDVVIPALKEFGYNDKDAYNYVTSACWEPFVYGKSIGNSNLANIDYAKAFNSLILRNNLLNFDTYEDVESKYYEILSEQLNSIKIQLNTRGWEKNPLMSLFTDGCKQSGKDISMGGAVYSDYGILSLGLANAVDSLLNIKNSFNDKDKLRRIETAVRHNYAGDDVLHNELKNNVFFGKDDKEPVLLAQNIIDFCAENLRNFKNKFGGKVKFGLSAPGYVTVGENTGATADGRKKGEPLSVHISAKLGEPYTGLINFAGKLNYNGIRCNGNVVDFFVSPSFIQNNFEKFFTFLKSGIEIGFYQMQMNVVSSETLIAAKKNPDLYPNLIVRVWGFSAYFKDLPEQYKDVLIQRALESEKAA